MTNRLIATYRVRSDAKSIAARAKAIAVEQSVEMPLEAIDDAAIHTDIVGRVEAIGDRGDGNASIPGADDGTVGVDEATFPGIAATVRLPVGHTGMTVAPEALRQVLHFLRQGAFAPAPEKQ